MKCCVLLPFSARTITSRKCTPSFTNNMSEYMGVDGYFVSDEIGREDRPRVYIINESEPRRVQIADYFHGSYGGASSILQTYFTVDGPEYDYAASQILSMSKHNPTIQRIISFQRLFRKRRAGRRHWDHNRNIWWIIHDEGIWIIEFGDWKLRRDRNCGQWIFTQKISGCSLWAKNGRARMY